MRFLPSFLLLLLVSLSGCSTFYDNKYIQWEDVQPDAYPILVAVGYAPVSAQPGKTQDQKVLMALRASKLDAYRELAEQVYGQEINSSTSLAFMVQNDAQLRASVSGLIRGAKVKESYPVGDLYATELELDMELVHRLYIATSKPKQIKTVRYY